MKDAEAKIEQYLESGQKNINGWKVGALFGDRAFYHGDWLKHARRQGRLAARPERSDLPGHVPLLAEGNAALHHPPGEGTWKPPGKQVGK
jgi:hypothetical protein